MGKHQYKKLEASTIRGICVKCNKNQQKPAYNGKFIALCRSCDLERTPATIALKRKYIKNARVAKKLKLQARKKPCCEKCDFIPEHQCQLDLDHIDGNHSNNDPSNHQTLCANCHRLKTYLNQDWICT